ncbi:MAG: membrane dipeptidase [Phycisphaerae bacterium]|nr:membrane dipeptidase [Gemmatimonadaceae bacterium]
MTACTTRSSSAPVDRVRQLLATTPLIDGHNDLLIHYLGADRKALGNINQYDIRTRAAGQVDIPRMRAGHLGATIFTVGINDPNNRKAAIVASTSLLRGLAQRSPADVEIVTNADAIMRAFKAGRIAGLMGLEGGDQIGGSLDVLRAAYQSGVRAMTLMWERTNDIGDASSDVAKHQGLSMFGDSVVREMNRLGMLVDLSHASDSAAFDALVLSTAPVILSHSSVRALTDASRNVSDTLLRRVASNGGIVMVTFVAYFTTPAYLDWYKRGDAQWLQLMFKHKSNRDSVKAEFARWQATSPPPVVTVRDVADHIEHVRDVAGIDHVGIGADFDGMDDTRIMGLEDASTYPAVFTELMRRGWRDDALRKLAGENFLRVLRKVEATAAP